MGCQTIHTLSSLSASVASNTPLVLNCEMVSCELFNTDLIACLVLTDIAIPGCSRCNKPGKREIKNVIERQMFIFVSKAR